MLVALGGLTLSAIAATPSPAVARQDTGSYSVDRPVFALVAPDSWLAQRKHTIGFHATKQHVPNPAFAGYSTAQTGVTDLVARFKVPGVLCSKKEAAIGPGAFLLAGPRDRLSFNAANIIVGCYRGAASAQEAIEVNSVESDFVRPLEPGDVIVAHLTDTPGGRIVVRLRNLNPHRKWVLTRTGRGAAPNVELVGDWASVDANTGAQVPPPDFDPTTFRGVSLDGRPLGSASATSFNMASSSNVLQITTSPLRGAARDTFTCRRLSRG